MAASHRIFVSFAMEDARYRDLLKGQAQDEQSPFEFIDMSVKEPWSQDWKTRCRSRIRGCDGTIALLSKNTINGSGARWEINCSLAEGIRVLGVWIHQDDHSAPPEMDGQKKIGWTWQGIAEFLGGL